MKQFEFPIYGYECDDYCYSIVDKYGENSEIARLLDKNYDQLTSKSIKYVDQLNAVREFLCDNGFRKEVEEQDKIFLEKAKKLQRKQPTPLTERWRKDSWK